MIKTLRRIPRKVLRKYGYDLIAYNPSVFPPDFSADDIRTCEAVRPYTMTSPERVAALAAAVRYIASARVPGAIVECGVWRGGSMMAVARTLLEANETSRDLFLFDTFEGLPRPGNKDIAFDGVSGLEQFEESRRGEDSSDLCYAPLDDVKRNMANTGYPAGKIHYVRGKVEISIPEYAPAEIAILRLDTDWYESTRHELTHLFPRVSRGGVVIIDDYGHWRGAREATDEYFAGNETPVLMNRVDYSGRVIVKV